MPIPHELSDVEAATNRIVLLADVVATMDDLPALIEAFERADAFGVFIDPTAWTRSFETRRSVLPLIRAANDFRAASLKFQAERDRILAEQAGRA